MTVNEKISLETDSESATNVLSSGPCVETEYVAYSVFHAFEMFKRGEGRRVSCSNLLPHETISGVWVFTLFDSECKDFPAMPYFIVSGDSISDNHFGEILPDELCLSDNDETK